MIGTDIGPYLAILINETGHLADGPALGGTLLVVDDRH